MPRLYDEFSHDLAWTACSKAFDGKWRRNDIRNFIEEWTGYSRYELMRHETGGSGLTYGLKYEILEEIADSTEDMIEGIMHGVDPDFDPVTSSLRRDGNTGKIRNIATLCIRHQILGHVVKAGLEKLFHARIMQTQHASIPERGQTALARQIRRMLRSRKNAITQFIKTDCTGAYASVLYSLCRRIIAAEIPRARWIDRCLAVLERYAPGGCLIIGGYLDAWLFNFVYSYAMRKILSMQKSRRGNRYPLAIRAVSFMDDMALLGRSEKDLMEAIKRATVWMSDNLNLKMRQTAAVIRLHTTQEEKRRKKLRGAKRGCPGVDMGGYIIHRTYITIRKRNVPKIQHAFREAAKDMAIYKTMRRQRAAQVISRNGMIRNSNSRKIEAKYDTARILRAAKKNQSHWSRQTEAERRERIIHAERKHQINVATLCGYA